MSPDSAAALLSELAAKSITLAVEGDYLRCRPRSAVTRDLVERIRGHKAELLAILQDTDTTDTDRTIAVGSESGFVAENTPLLLYSQAERDLLAGAPTDMWRAVDRIKQAFSGAQVIDVFRSPAGCDVWEWSSSNATRCRSRQARKSPSGTDSASPAGACGTGDFVGQDFAQSDKSAKS